MGKRKYSGRTKQKHTFDQLPVPSTPHYMEIIRLMGAATTNKQIKTDLYKNRGRTKYRYNIFYDPADDTDSETGTNLEVSEGHNKPDYYRLTDTKLFSRDPRMGAKAVKLFSIIASRALTHPLQDADGDFYAVVSIRELCRLGLWKKAREAEEAIVDHLLDTIGSIQTRLVVYKRDGKKEYTGYGYTYIFPAGVVFSVRNGSTRRPSESIVAFKIDKSTGWDTLARYTTIYPKWAYTLNFDAFQVLGYIMHRLKNGRTSITAGGRKCIIGIESLYNHLLLQLDKPSNPRKEIKQRIQNAIREVIQVADANGKSIQIAPMFYPGRIALGEWLARSSVEIWIENDFADSVQKSIGYTHTPLAKALYARQAEPLEAPAGAVKIGPSYKHMILV